MATVTRTFELSEDASEALDRYAYREGQTPERLIENMLRTVTHQAMDVGFTSYELSMIEAGEAEADAGNFATEEELLAVLRRYQPAA